MDDLDILKEYLLEEMGDAVYKKWIEPLVFIGKKKKILFLGSPDLKNYNYFKSDNILKDINIYTKKNFDYSIKIVSLFEDNINEDFDEDKIKSDDDIYSYDDLPNTNLRQNFTFDSFIQRESNQFAYSLAYNVSEFPGTSYNPLYIYSDVGLGKTHLLNAIGNKILKNNKNMRVNCLTSSEFMYQFTEYTRKHKTNDFISKFESLDVLLIDDIQFITKWAGTKEQFFNIFNKLINQEKQIVICSDTHPDDIPGLENRIKSRFVMGGLVDIKPYDLEGRLAILKKKVEERKKLMHQDFYISNEVLYFIAEKVTKNIRAVEGALNRLIATANLKFSDKKGIKIDIPFTKKALEPFINLNKVKISFDSIQEYIANKHGIKKSDLISKSNKNDIAFPRQIAMYLCKKLINCTLSDIGKNFGGKHHSTVLHSIKKVETKIENDYDFSIIVNNYEEYFQ